MLGKLDWSAIPLDQPIPMITSGVVVARHPRGSRLGRSQGPPALSVEGVDHQRRPQADRRHVTLLAMVMLLRGLPTPS